MRLEHHAFDLGLAISGTGVHNDFTAADPKVRADGMHLTPDPYADIALVAPYAVNWQIRETTRSELDSPRVDMGKLVTIIRRSGYRGYLPIETLSMGRKDYDPRVEATAMLKQLRADIAATESSEPAARERRP